MRPSALALAACLAAAAVRGQGPPEERALVPAASTWRLLPGVAAFPEGWREPGFDESAWRPAPAGIGYGDDDDATTLEDMRGRYLSIALRQSFHAGARGSIAWLELRVDHDDGFVAWLNGVEIARQGLDGDPPPHDARARDHEAGRWSVFQVPPELMRRGENVLAAQVHNSDLHSSDLSFRAELAARVLEPPADAFPDDDEAPAAARVPEPAGGGEVGRWSAGHALRSGAGHVSNYFQSRAGSPKRSVASVLIGYELALERRTKGGLVRVRSGLDADRFEGLGTVPIIASRVEWRRPRTRLDAGAQLKLDRPSVELGDQLGRADTLEVGTAWTWRPADLVAWQLGAGWTEERNELDPLRSNEQVAWSTSVRFLPDARRLSPELGLERGTLRARDRAFDYDQWRWRIQLVTRPGRTVHVSLLGRLTERDYVTNDPASSNLGRSDRRRLVRALVAWRPTRRVGIVGWTSWEDGDSSRPFRAFEGWTSWAGLTLHF